MSTKRNDQKPVDGWEGLAEAIAKSSKVKRSQCGTCNNKVGTHACKIFGERPYQYSSVLANVQCPERKEK